jgi:hypothetical protein
MTYANILRGLRSPEPAPLYVQRKLMNAKEFIAWAKSQGFAKVLAPEELHVTICYSKEAMDWGKAGNATENLTVTGGVRSVSPLGDGGAVVLKFESDDLQKRWSEFRAAGASWDYPNYTPHVTITYKNGDLDLSGIEPYTGRLVFGPEIYEPINDTYAADVVEKTELAKILAPKP